VTTAAAFALSIGTASAAPPPVELQDPTGDSGPGPDITKVTVSADDTGMLTFRVEVPNRPTVSSTMVILVHIDTDSNPATGDQDGSEYGLGMVAGSVVLGRLTGTEVDFIEPSSASGGYANGVATLSVKAVDLGVTSSFRFWVEATDNVDDNSNYDGAPGSGKFAYSLQTGTVAEMEAVLLNATVLFPKPGKVVSARGAPVRLDNKQIVRPETMECTLKLAHKTIAPLTGGCKWRIPKSAAGKPGTLKVTVTYQGQTATFTAPVLVDKK
jgi:hypothetical protein